MLERGKYVPANSVARWFINNVDREAGEAITSLKLQKLVYYAQAWYLANFDRPLFKDDFEAWAHGPVHPGLYHSYKHFGWDALPPQDGALPPVALREFLRKIYESYGQLGAKRLERLTHQELPWKEARSGLSPEAASNNRILKLTMRNFYAEQIGKKPKEKIQS